MTKVELKREILSLPVDERLELAETADPDAGSPWEEVKQRILASLHVASSA